MKHFSIFLFFSSQNTPSGKDRVLLPFFNDYISEINVILGIVILMGIALIVFAYFNFKITKSSKEYHRLSKENSERKKLLYNTLSAMSEGVITFDSQLNIIEINSAAKEMSSYSGDFIGHQFDEIFQTSQPESEIPVKEALQKAFKDKIRVTIANETKINYLDRESRRIAGTISPVIDSEGNVVQLVFVFYDKTETFNQKRFLRLALESAKSFTWFFDTFSNKLSLDENFSKYLGHNCNEVPDISLLESKIHPDDRETLLNIHRKVGKESDKNFFQAEYRLSFDGGKTYEWWESRGITFVDRSGNSDIKYIYGMDINIDEHKKRKQELLEAKIKAEESDKLKTAFLSNMSHEIRTPLNGIVGFANLLTEPGYSDEEKKEFIEIINESSRRLLTLIGDVLDLSKIESNTMTFDIRLFDLSDNINDVVNSYRNHGKPNVKLMTDYPKESVIVKFDQVRNIQILNNLINNALKFTESGEVRVGYRVLGNHVEVFVSDTGIGIEENKIPFIFDRFFKVNEYVSGTGIGLPLCKAIVTKLGGTIWAESQLGKGTTIRYTINLVNVGDKSVKPDSKNETEKEKPLILIAEDMESNYQLL
ncbi:MAG TPA: PAS domain-containing sensor histidine kinase, partial [Bacteroidales bacterium]|nr:PAS domain-containing sensor histidine kinase [Bacteroidales bacterium]